MKPRGKKLTVWRPPYAPDIDSHVEDIAWVSGLRIPELDGTAHRLCGKHSTIRRPCHTKTTTERHEGLELNSCFDIPELYRVVIR